MNMSVVCPVIWLSSVVSLSFAGSVFVKSIDGELPSWWIALLHKSDNSLLQMDIMCLTSFQEETTNMILA